MLPLFSHGVAQTIHVSVLVGVLVLLFFTETFGWVFSGLVVPGYLASVLVVEPAAAGAILGEALVTFVLARFLSDVLSKTGAWSPFFGRERFVLLIVVSVVVRQASEVWLLPAGLRWVDDHLGTTYHLSRSVASIGLVLVPLTANMFWKLDVRRGLVQVLVPTAITFGVVSLLLAHTNLSFSSLELTYEDVALDFLASPKAYILLCTGAYLASRYNLLYGWDYSGILVPALLGLAVFSPLRLVTSAAETTILVIAVTALVRLPGLRTMNLEGPRKIALVFTASFALKYLLGFLPGAWLHGLKVTDLFGFGYLVPSLMAVKILQKQAFERVLAPSFAVAFATFVVGSGIGFALDRVAPPPALAAERADRPPTPTTALLGEPMGAMALAHVRARLDVAGEVPLARPWRERQRYDALWRAVAAWLRSGGTRDRAGIEPMAASLGLALVPLERPVGERPAWALVEAEERLGQQVGWDTAVLIPGAPGPVIEVPRPWTEAPAAEAAAVLCSAIECRAVIASGVDTHEVRIPDGDAVQSEDAPLGIAHRRLRSAPVVQIRADADRPRGQVTLHVAGEVPDDLGALWPSQLQLSWSPPPGRDVVWDRGGRVSALVAHPDDLWQLIADRSAPLDAEIAATPLEAWLTADDGGEAAATYTAPSQSELRFLEEVLARPLVSASPAGLDGAARLRLAHRLASLIGYDLHQLADGAGPGAPVWVLAEKPARRRGWGTLAGRIGRAAPIAVELPRPRREAGTLHLGAELWIGLDAKLLLVAGADGIAGADAAAPWHPATPFQVLHQAIHAGLAGADQPLIAEVRGFSSAQPVRDGLVVSLGRALLDVDEVPPRLARALLASGPLGFVPTSRFYDGSLDLLDLAGTGQPQLAYSARVGGVAHAILWFSERVRDGYRGTDRERERARFAPAGLDPAPQLIGDALLRPALAPRAAPIDPALSARFDRVAAVAGDYAARGSVQALRRLTEVAADADVAVSAGWSPDLGRPYLRLEARRGRQVVRGVVLVPGGEQPEVRLDAAARDVRSRLATALLGRARLVTVAGALP